MPLMQPGILLITGIMAAGKSTIAQRAAERLEKSVHLRGDIFRRMIVSGRAEMTPDAPEEAVHQLELRYRLATQTARSYFNAGFTVVYQDIILGHYLRTTADQLRDLPLYVVVLCPSPEVVAQREAGRGKVGYGDWTPAMLDAGLRADTPRLGLWLDSSGFTVDETVDTILAQANQARFHKP